MRRHVIIFVALVGLVPRWAVAQIAAPPPPPRQEATAEFAFVGTTGNASTQSLGLSGDYIYRPAPWTFKAKAGYVRNEAESTLNAESFNFGFDAGRVIRPRLSVFGRYDFLHDRFAGIDDRQTLEGGVAYLAVDDAPHKLAVDAALGYAHESPIAGVARVNGILTLGATYTLKISDTAQFDEGARFVFSLADQQDWRVANVASVTARLTTRLSLKCANTIRFVNEPVPTFRKTDTITAVALVAKF